MISSYLRTVTDTAEAYLRVFQGSGVAAGPGLDEAELVSMAGCEVVREARSGTGFVTQVETMWVQKCGPLSSSWTCSEWLQTITDACRTWCKHPRGNGVAQHLLEDGSQHMAHTYDWSQLVAVHKRTTGLSVRRRGTSQWVQLTARQPDAVAKSCVKAWEV